MDEKQLYEEIEKRRKHMHQISKQKPLSSPDVVKVSKQLDHLLNQLQNTRKKTQ
ncbi:aspartyl-phosphate phosphatase Spo0E family protein [Bacillaceae bacterium S4-13-58]